MKHNALIKKLSLGTLFVSTLSLGSVASAGTPVADKNEDGVISEAELIAYVDQRLNSQQISFRSYKPDPEIDWSYSETD